MLSFEDALKIILDSARPLGTERVKIDASAGRVLAEDVRSDIDMPPFNKSAMDGFACRRADLGIALTVIETLPAGALPTKTIGPGQSAKIMTGGVVPEGADCVIMKEYVETMADDTVRFVGQKTKGNICFKGEDVKACDVVLKKGEILKPQHIAVLASVGCPEPLVAMLPKVGVISTGDELVDAASVPGPSQIRNSNSYQLVAQAQRLGAIATNYGIAKDTDEAIDSVFKKAIAENDVIVVSGGVSVGDFDLVPGILKQNGIRLLLEKIAVKPGRPTIFGISDDIFCFGLAGNPVSTFIHFELLVRPFLYKMMGCDYVVDEIAAPLEEAVKRKKTERKLCLPVSITGNGTIKPVEYHGSAHINALCRADGILGVDVGVAEIEKGQMVRVRLI